MNEESPATLELANLALKQAEEKSPILYHIIALFKIFKMYFLLIHSFKSRN